MIQVIYKLIIYIYYRIVCYIIYHHIILYKDLSNRQPSPVPWQRQSRK